MNTHKKTTFACTFTIIFIYKKKTHFLTMVECRKWKCTQLLERKRVRAGNSRGSLSVNSGDFRWIWDEFYKNEVVGVGTGTYWVSRDQSQRPPLSM